MGIVNKDKNTNKTVNGFAKGLISNSATMIRELANSKSYKIDITTDGIVVGELELHNKRSFSTMSFSCPLQFATVMAKES